MPTETVTLTEEMARIVQSEIEAGRFSNPVEVVAAALRVLPLEEDEYNEKLAALRAEIEEGFASGVAEGNVFARVHEQCGLPPRKRSSGAETSVFPQEPRSTQIARYTIRA